MLFNYLRQNSPLKLFFWGLLFFLNSYEKAAFADHNAFENDFNCVKYFFENKYAPFDWKKSHFDWELEKSYKAGLKDIKRSCKSVNDYQQILKKFVASPKDFHTSVFFYTTNNAVFPLQVQFIEGKLIITEIEIPPLILRKVLSSKMILKPGGVEIKMAAVSDRNWQNFEKVKEGDEIIAVNGQAPKKIIAELRESIYPDFDNETTFALAQKLFFNRAARVGVDIPNKDTFDLIVRLAKTGNLVQMTLPWIKTSEVIKNYPVQNLVTKNLNLNQNLIFNSLPTKDGNQALKQLVAKSYALTSNDLPPMLKFKSLSKNFISPISSYLQSSQSEIIAEIKGKIDLKDDFIQIKDKRVKSFLPPMGEVKWESPLCGRIYAYISQIEDGSSIGYIYLPTFSYDIKECSEIMRELAAIIKRFEVKTDALVFDLNSNPGGNLLFMYAVLSLLTTEPLDLPQHSELLIQADVMEALEDLNELPEIRTVFKEDIYGYPLTTELIEQVGEHAEFIINSWQSGSRMTGLNFLSGISAITPHPVAQYSKPIVVLVNELNFSCGDLFPAILQDNNRAKIFGVTTAGAGGHVRKYEYPSSAGVAFISLTASIAHRTSGPVVENLGVTPNHEYRVNLKDLQNNYGNYIDELKKVIYSIM